MTGADCELVQPGSIRRHLLTLGVGMLCGCDPSFVLGVWTSPFSSALALVGVLPSTMLLPHESFHSFVRVTI